MRVLERKSQPLLRHRVSAALRAQMKALGLTAKELSRQIEEQTPHRLDFRTIQNACLPDQPSCSLDTYEVLIAFFGWDFADITIEPVVGASRLASLEKEIAHEQAIIRGKEARLARLRAAGLAQSDASGGALRLVGS
jgi:hypothetical protein